MGPYLIGVPERKLGFSEAPLLARARKNHYRMKPFSNEIHQLTLDTLREKIVYRLEILFRVSRDTTDGNFDLPPVQSIAEEILFPTNSIPSLNAIYTSLVENGTQSEYFLQVIQFLGG